MESLIDDFADLAVLPNSSVWKEDWALSNSCTQFSAFLKISPFPNILNLNLFGYS